VAVTGTVTVTPRTLEFDRPAEGEEELQGRVQEQEELQGLGYYSYSIPSSLYVFAARTNVSLDD